VPPQSRKIRLLALRYPSVRPSTCINEASAGGLYDKFDIGDYNKNLSKNSKLITIENIQGGLSEGKINRGTEEI
jgi:hypothetical protein